MCRMIYSRVYKPTVWHVASLFLDIKEVTMLLGEYTMFARADLYYPTTRLSSYFSTIFLAYVSMYSFKLLLHPNVHVYTRKCAANIVKKYELIWACFWLCILMTSLKWSELTCFVISFDS